MSRPSVPLASALTSSDLSAALSVLDLDALRGIVERACAEPCSPTELRARVIELAVRSKGPEVLAPDTSLAEDAARLVRSAKRRTGTEVMLVLARAQRAVWRGDHAVAKKAFESMLDIAVEQVTSERSGEDPEGSQESAIERGVVDHAGSYLVATYGASPARLRVGALLDALERLSPVEHVTAPLLLLETSAPAPLDGWSEFVREWASALEAMFDGTRPRRSPFRPAAALLTEALAKVDGLSGMARAARRVRDLEQYRALSLKLLEAGKTAEAIDICQEAGTELGDTFGRGVMLDAAWLLAHRAKLVARSESIAEQAFVADPSMARFCRWLLGGSTKREAVTARTAEARSRHRALLSPRMTALLAALSLDVDQLAAALEGADDAWERDEHPGWIAFPAALVLVYGGPKGTAVAAKVCAPLFGAGKGVGDWRGWAPPNPLLGDPPVPLPGPHLVEAARELSQADERAGKDRAAQLGAALRKSAAERAAAVLTSRDRPTCEACGALLVAAAEVSYRSGHHDLARAYLGELARAAARHPTFRSALERSLAKSELINAL